MPSFLCLTIRFLQPYAHGRRDGGEAEWPPSPLRIFQALVAASAGRWNERRELVHAAPALRWLESLAPPVIVASAASPSTSPYLLYVPNNAGDIVARSWSKGHDASLANHRTEKGVRPIHLSGEAVHYLYALPENCQETDKHVVVFTEAARSITHVGWGIDMATGNAQVLLGEEAARLEGQRWLPSDSGGTPLRTPVPDTLCDLTRKHADFLARLKLKEKQFRPVPPLKRFRVVSYRSADDVPCRPFRVFELRHLDGRSFRYPHRRLIHIAGMLRHLAIETMRNSPPEGLASDWVETYIAGHAGASGDEHRQLSYLPLPSIGHAHADPGVRRVMLAAAPGEEAWLDHLARRLAGQCLKPERGDEFPEGVEPPLLVPMRHDGVVDLYTGASCTWHSVTPIILPGHDDHKSAKTRKLIEKALAQSGIEQPCTFDWNAHSRFPKMPSAHKYGRDKKPVGFFRPDHLMTQTAVHLTLRFNDELTVPGPLVIGAGRHCGFGLMAIMRHGRDERQ